MDDHFTLQINKVNVQINKIVELLRSNGVDAKNKNIRWVEWGLGWVQTSAMSLGNPIPTWNTIFWTWKFEARHSLVVSYFACVRDETSRVQNLSSTI